MRLRTCLKLLAMEESWPFADLPDVAVLTAQAVLEMAVGFSGHSGR